MARSWRAPGQVMRKILADGPREDRAIAYLLVACVLVVIAQWPRLVRAAAGFELAPGATPPDLQRELIHSFYAWLIIMPLVMYLIAALSHVVAKIFGGKGTWYSSRMALFWSFLATTPALLLWGLTAGFVGPGPALTLVGIIWVAAFTIIWAISLYTAEQANVV
ncbi:YIP1 family protein [Yoonia sp. 208BN28-4]|uniref:YIP1 family protein n=1 Tax=Yoonia sp. 208BN28-4 TaxID=3126505 RepID=UPI0030A5D4CC